MDMASGSILFSFEDVVQMLVLEGLTRLAVWEHTFDTIKTAILNESNVAVVNIFILLRSALLTINEKINEEELSEYKILKFKDTELTLDNILDYFKTAMGEKFNIKEIGFDSVKRFKELIRDSFKSKTSDVDKQVNLMTKKLVQLMMMMMTILKKISIRS